MYKRDYWKQPGPGMQITTILSSLQEHHSNMNEEIISKIKYDHIFKEHMRELLELADMLRNTNWE